MPRNQVFTFANSILTNKFFETENGHYWLTLQKEHDLLENYNYIVKVSAYGIDQLQEKQ